MPFDLRFILRYTLIGVVAAAEEQRQSGAEQFVRTVALIPQGNSSPILQRTQII
jgi:hypothetical protein